MRSERHQRGLFIISALLVSFVIVLFISAALKLSNMNLKATNTASRRAMAAAESGLRYVQSCQAEDYTWSADRGLVVETPDLVVREDNGNIVGILRTEGGDFAQFRIRFNYQDDSGENLDGRADPDSLVVDSQYVSVQNILGGSPFAVPRADGPGWSVSSASPRPYKVPAGSTCVIVEGRYGPGLANLSSGNLNPDPTGKITTRVVEGYLEAPAPPGGDSAAQAAGNMDFLVEGVETVSLTAKSKEQASRLRSRAAIAVQGGDSPNLVSDQGETYTIDGSVQADVDSNTQVLTEDTNQDFLSISWDEVKKATTSDSQLPAGTYVLWDDGSIHYYDMDYDSFSVHTEGNPTDQGTVVGPDDLPDGMRLDTSDPAHPKLVIEKNIFVEGTSETDELTIIPRKGAQEDPPGSDSVSELADAAIAQLDEGYVGGSVDDATRIEAPQNTAGGMELDVPSGVANPFQIVLHNNHFHVLSYNEPGSLQSLNDFAQLMSQPGMTFQERATAILILQALGGTPESMGEFDLGNVQPSMRADNITVSFEPPEGESAILSAAGDVRLGTNVKGVGGAITSEGNIRLVGHGTAFEASEENGLALYAKGDVVVSSLKEVPVGSNNWEYKDVDFKGVVYSWSNIEAKLSHDDSAVTRHGRFFAQGAMVAYGGDPEEAPGSNGQGTIRVDADGIELKYDPVYILQLSHLPPSGPLVQTLHTTY